MAAESTQKYTYDYPRPTVTVDAVVTAKSTEDKERSILLVQRARPPYQECWALPGGFVNIDEGLETALQRELWEETGIHAIRMHQLGTYGEPGRDPRGRVISVVYYVQEYNASAERAADDAFAVGWFALAELPPLAFDHKRILEDFKNNSRPHF